MNLHDVVVGFIWILGYNTAGYLRKIWKEIKRLRKETRVKFVCPICHFSVSADLQVNSDIEDGKKREIMELTRQRLAIIIQSHKEEQHDLY